MSLLVEDDPECEHCACWNEGRRCCDCGAGAIEWPECDEHYGDDDDQPTD